MEEGQIIAQPLLGEERNHNGPSSSSSSSANWVVIFSVFVVTCGSFGCGCGIGYSSPAQSSIMEDLGLSTAEYSVFGSILTFGGMLGATVSGKLADLVGRRGTMWIFQTFGVTGWLAIIFAKDACWLDLGRLSLGIGYGMYFYLAPIYLAEITPKDIRGACVSAFQLTISCGFSLMFFIGNFIHWRTLAVIGIMPCIVQVIGIFFTPESPRWLAKTGREKEVQQTLQRLRGKHADTSEEAAEIKKYTENFQRLSGSRSLDLFQRKYANSLIIGLGLMILLQFGGTSGISYYASSIFEVAGTNVSVGTTTMAITQVMFSAMSLLLVDRYGRRPLLMVTAAGACFGISVAGVAFLLKIYFASYSMGLASVPSVIMSEIFPINVKGQAGSLLTLANSFSAWVVSYTFNFLYEWSSSGVFFIFAGVCLLMIIFAAKMVPETKGRTLEEIQASMT